VDKTSVLSGVDMLPTLCAAAGVSLPADYQPDGINALSILRGEITTRTRPVFWEWRDCIIVRGRIPLTKTYIESRLKELRDTKDSRSKLLVEKYGPAHHQQIIAWFEQALRI
jgi:hypothetical protein